MKRYKFAALLQQENRIKDKYLELGLSISPYSRINKYFLYLREIEKARILGENELNRLIQKDRARYYYSQLYVLKICNILNAIESSSQNQLVIRNKLSILAKGPYLLSEEHKNNTTARDAEFELELFSFLYEKGLKVRLCDPNPDIQLITSNFTYDIECKRPNSMNSMEKHIRKAVSQLKKIINGSNIPTIALSLDSILTKDDLILSSKDERSSLNFLNVTLSEFLKANAMMVSKICGSNPCLVLYHLSCLSGYSNNIPMAYTTYMTGNIYNFEKSLSRRIYDDLQIMT
ncbi:MAG: hypothetical protein WD000_08210 [Thermodesulfobacteriota bacterium]